MGEIFKYILKIRWFIIFLVVSITLFLAFQIPGIKINSDVISSLPDDDPDAVLLKRISAQFGGNKMGMVIMECENIFTNDLLRHVKQVTEALEEIEGISSVTSLTNIMDIKEDEFGMEVGRLVDEDDLPYTTGDLDLLKERVMSKEMYKGVIVSEDGTATLIIFSLNDEANIRTIANEVKYKTQALQLPENIYYAGSPMMITTISHLIASDLKRLFPIAFLLIAISLFIGFKTIRGLILPLLSATIAIVWVIGIMALGGFEMSMVSNNIPIVLLAVGTAYSIHVLNRIGQVREDMNKAIVIALISVAIPVILAALTTMTGFVSFIFGSYLTMIRDFGIFTALGAFIAVVLALTFVPAVISIFPGKNKRRTDAPENNPRSVFLRLFHSPLQSVLIKHTNKVLIFWIMLTVISIGGIFLIERNVDIRNYFRKGNPTRVAEDIMNEKFGGTKPIFVLFRGDVQSPELLKTMLLTEEHMKKSSYVTNTQSIAGLILEMNGAMGDAREIPDEKEKIEQLWFLIDGNESIGKFVSDDLDEAIIISRFLSPDNNAKKEFAVYMNNFIEAHSSEALTIGITGMPFIDVTMDRSLINSQLSSLSIALLFVIIIVGIFLRSLRSGLFATIPIISGIVILFGVMGYAGIPLNIATVLVASIALGIGIDYSIHVITHFNDSFKKGSTIANALEETIRISGKAIIINVISVSAGFLVLLFSEMVPLQYFGLLIFLSMVGSGLSALTLLPVILILNNKGRSARQTKQVSDC